MESISGRVDDLIVYLLLFKAMVVERDRPQQCSNFDQLYKPPSSKIDVSKAQQTSDRQRA